MGPSQPPPLQLVKPADFRRLNIQAGRRGLCPWEMLRREVQVDRGSGWGRVEAWCVLSERAGLKSAWWSSWLVIEKEEPLGCPLRDWRVMSPAGPDGPPVRPQASSLEEAAAMLDWALGSGVGSALLSTRTVPVGAQHGPWHWSQPVSGPASSPCLGCQVGRADHTRGREQVVA